MKGNSGSRHEASVQINIRFIFVLLKPLPPLFALVLAVACGGPKLEPSGLDEPSLRVCVAEGTGADENEALSRCTGTAMSSLPIRFGLVEWSTELPRTISVANRGSAPIELTSISLVADPDQYWVQAPMTPYTLKAGETLYLFVTLTAFGAANVTALGTLTISSTDTVLSEVKLTLTGNVSEANDCRGCTYPGPGSVPADQGEGQHARAWPGSLVLPFEVVDAEYSRVLESVISVSANPHVLTIINAETNAMRTVALQSAPMTVGISPDGREAIVGHDGWLSVVNLETATLVKTLPLHAKAGDVVHLGSHRGLVFPAADTWVHLAAIDLESGVEQFGTDAIWGRTTARLQRNGPVYGADASYSAFKYGGSFNTPFVDKTSPFDINHDACGQLWFSEEGSTIVTGCGHLFKPDFAYVARLPNVTKLTWVDDSTSANALAAINNDFSYGNSDSGHADEAVLFFNRSYTTLLRRDLLPDFPGTKKAAHAHFVFWSTNGTHYVVLAKADDAAKLAPRSWAMFKH